MANSFSINSTKEYVTLHNDLQVIFNQAIAECNVDFSLTEGHRPVEKQFEYYKRGRKLVDDKWIVSDSSKIITNVDGYKIKGNHNMCPSLAVDIAVYVKGKPNLTYDPAHLAYIAGTIMSIAVKLFKDKKITHKLRWGGDWNENGDLTDSRLPDMPHFEIYKPK